MLSDKKWHLILGVSALIGIIALVLINIYKPFTPSQTPQIAKSAPKQQCNAPNRMDSGGGNPYTFGTIGNILGDKDAKLIIHEYTDYQCPYCAMTNEMLLRLSKEVKGIKVAHHDFPLDKECNPYIRGSIHPMACQAAYYAKAAKKQGKFWDMATLLYEHKDELSEEKILQLAKKLDLDVDKLKKDVADNKEIFKQEIAQDVEKAKKLGISGTPTIVIGIKKHEGAMPYPQLKQMVLESLQQ
jgi:protein-disulfide isomerase